MNEDMTVKLSFFASPSFIVLIVLVCLYAFAALFGKLYPRMQPKVAETVGKVADKVKSHKSKSERIEELERQNAEIQRQLDELKRKDQLIYKIANDLDNTVKVVFILHLY